MKNFLLLLGSLVFTLILAFGSDRLLGLLASERQNIIFKSGTLSIFETPEFSYTAKINSLGFRDYEVKAERSAKTRIMTLGDSFTFGSGVSLKDTWTKQLESAFAAEDCSLEALNLGRGGRAVDGYAEIAEKAIPILRPDIVLVAVLQGDDLGQSLIKVAHQKRAAKLSRAAKKEDLGREQKASFIEEIFPNFVELRRRLSPDTIEMRAVWRSLAQEFESTMKQKYRSRFEAIPMHIVEMFRSGGLNPGLVSLAIKKPDHLRWTLSLEEPLVKDAIAHLSSNLGKIREAAERVGAEVIVFSMPSGAYTSAVNLENYGAMGFSVDESFLTATGMDEAIAVAASENGLRHFEFTERFRDVAKKSELFFPFDGHITELGHQLFAEEVQSSLKTHLGACARPSVED